MTAPCPLQVKIAYARLCRTETLRQAWAMVRKGGPAPGVDGQTLDQFAAVAEAELRHIETDLKARRYRFLPVRRTFIGKLSGGRRRLGIPAIGDRVVEQAIRLLLEPILALRFAVGSFAYRSGRGVQQAIDRLLEHRRHGNAWILESDVEDFFDTIDHTILLDRLRAESIDEDILRLIAASLTAGVRLGRRWFASPRGVPQGSPLSPLLANYYLTPFDDSLADEGHELIRYADDLVVCCPSRHEAQRASGDLRRELARLKLKVNPAKTRILDSRRDRFEFLGFAIGPGAILPASDSIQRFRRAVAESLEESRGEPLTRRIEWLNPLVRSFACYYARCGAATLYGELDSWIEDRLRKSAGLPARGHAVPLSNLVRLVSYLQPHCRPWVHPASTYSSPRDYGGWCKPRVPRRESG